MTSQVKLSEHPLVVFILAVRRLSQENVKFKFSLGYMSLQASQG